MTCPEHGSPSRMCSCCGRRYCDDPNHGHTYELCMGLLEERKRKAEKVFLEAAEKLRKRGIVPGATRLRRKENRWNTKLSLGLCTRTGL